METSLVARRSSLVGRSARSCILFAGFSAFCAELPAQIQPAVTIATRSFADSGYLYAPGEGCPGGLGHRVYETAIAVNGDYQRGA